MKRGRPHKPADEVRSCRFMLRLTTEERDQFEAAANAQGESLSEWIRRACVLREIWTVVRKKA